MKKIIKQLVCFIFVPLVIGCFFSFSTLDSTQIECSNNECKGQYIGAEFINGSDIAHQFSNTMSKVVGDKLKELFNKGIYSKVDFDNIQMTTKGMGSGNVTYFLKIPFKKVKQQCDAFTKFDHVGGWNHAPALTARKGQLSKVLMANHQLNISDLKTTPEGLQEYWIQWKNKKTQEMCK